MRRTSLLLSAAATDWAVGDPEGWPHPVRLLGWAIARGDGAMARPHASPAYNLSAGLALTALVVGSAYAGSRFLLRVSRRVHPAAGAALEVWLASTCLAARSLSDEAAAVLRALEAGDLPAARVRVARIVGRDTESLDEAGVSRALIETLAESASDGVTAPLFYLALGGVPLAMAFKAASTLDSMIGHRDERYLFFGRAAARLDDLANLVPARLSALAILLFARGEPGQAARLWRRDARKHASPNAGHPEAAMAAALRVRLGGSNSYGGVVSHGPLLAAEYAPPSVRDARRALRITQAVSMLAAGMAVVGCLIATRRRT